MTPRRFTEDELRPAREADIVSLVARRVALKRQGGTFWGLCPFHKEKSPSFKVDNKRHNYHCFGCGKGGDAIDWLMEQEGMTFEQAVNALKGDSLPSTPMVRPAYAPKPVEDRDAYKEAERIWKCAVPAKGTVVEEYLRARGIRLPVSDELRFASRLLYGPTRQHYRAMVARISDDRGFCAIQRTFLLNDRPEKIRLRPAGATKDLPAKMSKGPMRCGAVRLSQPVGEVLGIAEGVETALSVKQLYHLPMWATLGTARLINGSVEIPKQVKSLVIFGDAGEPGRVAAFEAAEHYERKGLGVEVIFPAADFPELGADDFNTVLQRKAS